MTTILVDLMGDVKAVLNNDPEEEGSKGKLEQCSEMLEQKKEQAVDAAKKAAVKSSYFASGAAPGRKQEEWEDKVYGFVADEATAVNAALEGLAAVGTMAYAGFSALEGDSARSHASAVAAMSMTADSSYRLKRVVADDPLVKTEGPIGLGGGLKNIGKEAYSRAHNTVLGDSDDYEE